MMKGQPKQIGKERSIASLGRFFAEKKRGWSKRLAAASFFAYEDKEWQQGFCTYLGVFI